MSTIELKGFDNRGKVYLDDDCVRRIIQNEYKPKTRELFNSYQKHLVGKDVVETSILEDGNLSHKRIPITYPFEWSPSMFKDALLFNLRLLLRLEKHDLTLKDGLPENILFENTRPILVDFLSLVFLKDLADEDWLYDKKFNDQRFSVFTRMFIPHFLVPFFIIARGQYAEASRFLTDFACNCSSEVPTWKDLLRKDSTLGYKKFGLSLKDMLKVKVFFKVHSLKNDFSGFVRALESHIQSIDVVPPKSGYADYYEEKGEDAAIYDPAILGIKQRSVYTILKSQTPRTVIDIGANTGWYSFMAAHLGAKVYAIEADPSCADLLYQRAKAKQSAINVICSDFSSLQREIFALKDSAPLYRSALERISADVVLVLGLSHHLVLGEGYSIQKIFELLARPTKTTLVLEYIDLEDDKIVLYPDFFPKRSKFDRSNYNLDTFTAEGLKFFTSVEVMDSNPETRKVLVFKK